MGAKRPPAVKRRLTVWPLGAQEAHFQVKMAFGGALRAQFGLSGALRALVPRSRSRTAARQATVLRESYKIPGLMTPTATPPAMVL